MTKPITLDTMRASKAYEVATAMAVGSTIEFDGHTVTRPYDNLWTFDGETQFGWEDVVFEMLTR